MKLQLFLGPNKPIAHAFVCLFAICSRMGYDFFNFETVSKRGPYELALHGCDAECKAQLRRGSAVEDEVSLQSA